MLDVRDLVRNLFVLLKALHLWFATGGFCVVEKICVRGHCSNEGLLWLGSHDYALSKEVFSSIIDYIVNY